MQIGYCGNVHPGRTINEVKRNLMQHGLAVKGSVRPSDPLEFGLWLSATAAEELNDRRALENFRDWLADSGLVPFTFNGFPYGDFHQPIVKHDVYRPTWAEKSRLDYTIKLAEIQDALLPRGIAGTISTLPLGWPTQAIGEKQAEFFIVCAEMLRSCAQALSDIEKKSGRNILLCLEPEPGCLIDTCFDLVDFFEKYLLTVDDQTNATTRRHIGVCHDVCHSAVMFEDQRTAIGRYCEAGIRVGKIQVSSAISVDFDNLTTARKQQTLFQLSEFAEPRYLHQTSIKTESEISFFEDLPLALQQQGSLETVAGQWRVHFHVPIFAERLGLIGTTQIEIEKCLAALKEFDCATAHFEIETYAWNVLPTEWQPKSLAEGIAKEWIWFENLIETLNRE